MRKINYRLVFNRKKKLNKEGKALIQVEAYLDGKKMYISTHIYLFPTQWDRSKSRVINHPHEEEINRMLEEFILALQWKELKCWKKGKEITLLLLKEEPEQQKHFDMPFLQFSRKWVESSARKESTKNNMKTTLMLLQHFNKSLDFQDLTYKFLRDFEVHLRELGRNVNTIAKHMKHLKTFINEAINQGHMSFEDNPFKRYKIKTAEGKHCFLLPEEMEKLESLRLPVRWQHLQHTLDAFLFCCYTGLRYSDFTQLNSKNIVCIDNSTWLIFKSMKTGTEVRIPMFLLFQGKALKILTQYGNDLNSFFCLKPNSSVNKELIHLKKLAEIGKHFSFHTARHTNATLLIYKGVQITTVQKLLGHRSVKTTQLYSDIFPATIINDLKKCQF